MQKENARRREQGQDSASGPVKPVAKAQSNLGGTKRDVDVTIVDSKQKDAESLAGQLSEVMKALHDFDALNIEVNQDDPCKCAEVVAFKEEMDQESVNFRQRWRRIGIVIDGA